MEYNDLPNEDHSSEDSSKKTDQNKKRKGSSGLSDLTRSVAKRCQELKEKPGVHSVIHMSAAGWKYTGDQDSAICEHCNIKASEWKTEKKPFDVHSEQNPDCSFVLNVKSSARPRISTTTELPPTSIASVETDPLQQAQTRDFSHRPHRISVSSEQMVAAASFDCNEEKRIDSPTSSILIGNENPAKTTSSNHPSTSANPQTLSAACNPGYAELPKRCASFATWLHENSPSVDDLVRAGFFYTGTKNIVTCFYCNGSLHNWGPNDNPTIEHARWFPYCAYAKQLCGDEMYRKIQESKRAQQERARANEAKEKATTGVVTNNSTTNSGKLLIPDESTLSRLVAARLDLPTSQRLLDQHFKLSIIKRCWEDQLRLKKDDFVSESDLFMSCLILQKQIEHIDGKKENIVIPSIRMKEIRERNEIATREPAANATRPTATTADVEMTTSSQSLTNESTSSQSSVESAPKPTTTGTQGETKIIKTIPTPTAPDQEQSTGTPSNPCVLCLTEEKRLACIPCGHLATCVPCGHSLRSCPICQRQIEAFVRIYI